LINQAPFLFSVKELALLEANAKRHFPSSNLNATSCPRQAYLKIEKEKLPGFPFLVLQLSNLTFMAIRFGFASSALGT
jgi:hypothetical protein